MSPRDPAPTDMPCAHCGASQAPAVCTGCRAVSYCGRDCQRAAWKAGHKRECAGRPEAPAKSPGAAEPAEWREPEVRCPKCILGGKLPRLERLDSSKAQEMLCSGQAFVAPMEDLLGTRLLKWDFKYLQQHLPEETKYGVMLDEGSGKIVMSHSARNGERQVDMSRAPTQTDSVTRNSDEGLFNTSDQTRMTFSDFMRSARSYKRNGRQGKLPYFGLHLLWRFKEADNGFLGEIDEEMADDLWSVKFGLIKEWQDLNILPLVQRFYLFAGVGGTLYHCHYDLQPNLHVQLTGRKRFIIFPPEDWRYLYPFPVHHDLDRRSMVDLDDPSGKKFPLWSKARGHVVELCPGDALYIPPYWWHHVQSLTPETTSMAMWFFEFFPHSADVKYGICLEAEEVELLREVEELVGKFFPNAPGEDDCTKARPVKAAQVANYMVWLKQRLASGSGAVDGQQTVNVQLLGELTKPAEEVREAVVRLVVESGTNPTMPTESQAVERLLAFLDKRF